MPELLVVIPALNEEATVAQVVQAAREHLGPNVLVIDDGSIDHTAAVARAAGAMVIRHPFNLGVGAAIRTGFRYAAERGYDSVLQLDADGQHEPSEGNRLLTRLHEEALDIVVGSRFASGYKVSAIRRMGMRLLSNVVSRRLGVRITDTTGGFRAFGKSTVGSFALAYPSAYLSDTVEVLLLAGSWGLRVAEEPVHMQARKGGHPSSGATLSAVSFLRLAFIILLHNVRRPMPHAGSSKPRSTDPVAA